MLIRTKIRGQLFIASAILSFVLDARTKTDVVVMKNGDRITCEIVKLTHRQLQVKTGYTLGTLTLNWDSVAHVESEQAFLVEDVHGEHRSGPIRTMEPMGKLIISDRRGPASVTMSEVANIDQLGETFVGSLRAKVDLGSSYTSSNNLRQFTASSEIGYFTEKNSTRIYGNGLLNNQTGVPSTTSLAVTTEYFRTIKQNWLVGTQVDFQKNDQQQLDFRATVAAVVGRHLIRTNRTSLIGSGGLVLNRERFSEQPTGTDREGLLGVRYEFYKFDSTQVSTNIRLYPSISQPGRTRLQIDTNMYFDLWGDLYYKIGVSDSFDSRPPSDTSKNNITVTTGLGWKW